AAWRHLLQNHPHDSICGCSVDQVHKDMEYRFDQCEAIAELVLGDSLKRLALRVPGEVTSSRFPVVVANALAFPISEPVDLVLEVPNNGPEFQEFFGFERKPAFRIVDAKGAEVPYQRVHQQLESLRQQRCRRKFPHALRRHLVEVTVPLDLPSLGTRTLFVEAVPGPTRHPEAPLTIDAQTFENEFLTVVNSGGKLCVYDKETGADYMDLLTLEDCADIGDGWYHGVAVNDEVFLSSNSPSTTVLVQNGPFKATWRIEVEFKVPSEFDFSRMVRSSERTTLRVTHWVTLRRGARHVEVVTEVENIVRDHRLRVLFPSLIDAKTYWADTPFDAVERPIALRKDNHLAKELEVETKPQSTWTAVSGTHQIYDEGKCGLAIISKGLPESAVIDDEDRTIALTLLRAFRRAVFTDGNEGGQIQGKHRFEYWVVPFGGRVDPVELGRYGQRLAAGIRSAQAHPLDDKLEGPDHPDGYSLFEVEGDVLVTSARGTGQTGLFVRLYNPKATHAKIRITMKDGFARAARCDLRDQELEPLRTSGKKLNLVVEPKKIVTLYLEPRGAGK
ncbi:MAG: glycoside hydrolase family 38, partial [Candidatus Omnitrophica bacterium]|nr:glycoside hydrolase family 38 [Candidatus Omnitrophota bacterium]